jgi:hypothetical protein
MSHGLLFARHGTTGVFDLMGWYRVPLFAAVVAAVPLGTRLWVSHAESAATESNKSAGNTAAAEGPGTAGRPSEAMDRRALASVGNDRTQNHAAAGTPAPTLLRHVR